MRRKAKNKLSQATFRPQGDFLPKNSFGLNAFGVKYGNATLKPFIYFDHFFKGVTPSIQLSIGIGK